MSSIRKKTVSIARRMHILVDFERPIVMAALVSREKGKWSADNFGDVRRRARSLCQINDDKQAFPFLRSRCLILSIFLFGLNF